MTDIKWGPAIAVDGKRPGMIVDGEPIKLFVSYALGGDRETVAKQQISWPHIDAIALPADHPHYRQPAPIDWSGELEATDGSGKVWRVEVKEAGYDAVMVRLPDNFAPISDDTPIGGSYWSYDKKDNGEANPWLPVLRNVTPQPTPQADTKPDLTAEERAVALVREMGNRDAFAVIPLWMVQEARAIVALLPEPVDPDLIEARKLAAVWSESQDVSHSHYLDGHMDDSAEVRGMVAALARGRALARAGEKEA